LLNLLSNAFKFTKQGHVYLNVLPEDHAGNRYIRFDVEDTGIGIPLEKQESVFEQFTQADGRTTRKYGGTGLGLAITKQLAALLGGELTLTSELGKGSVFSLAIPVGVGVSDQHLLGELNDKGQENEGPQTTKQSKFAGHVLVAEDVKTNQVLARLLLEKMGLDVTVVDDGAEAVETVHLEEYDLILMDMQMPNMNGYEATQALRGQGVSTPVIALTARAMKGDREKCLEAGCDNFLAKPIGRHELMNILRKYISAEPIPA